MFGRMTDRPGIEDLAEDVLDVVFEVMALDAEDEGEADEA